MDINTWLTDFKTNFPEYSVIEDENGTDVTNTVLTRYLDIAMDLLPQGAVTYFTQTRLIKVVDYTVAHLLQYFDVLNNYDGVKALMRVTGSMSANGLSISYEGIAALRGDMFSSFNKFLNTTSYGQMVTVWLNTMAGSAGGYLV